VHHERFRWAITALAIAALRNGQLEPGLELKQRLCAVLSRAMVEKLIARTQAGVRPRFMRDPTRGGLAATLNEFALDTGAEITLQEPSIPVSPQVAGILDVLGMDPLILANEGKLLAFFSHDRAAKALEIMRRHPLGVNAAIIGTVGPRRPKGRVIVETAYHTRRVLPMPVEEGLPRIC
jgi:hydrogenase expression/formation protein HypE